MDRSPLVERSPLATVAEHEFFLGRASRDMRGEACYIISQSVVQKSHLYSSAISQGSLPLVSAKLKSSIQHPGGYSVDEVASGTYCDHRVT